MEPTQTPSQEPKKSFWSKIFGGNKSAQTTPPDQPGVFTASPAADNVTPSQSAGSYGADSFQSSNDTPAVTPNEDLGVSALQGANNFAQAAPQASTPVSEQVTPATEAAVDEALNNLQPAPEWHDASAIEATLPVGQASPQAPPTPPSDPMVTPIQPAPPVAPPVQTLQPTPPVTPEASDNAEERPPLTPPNR